MLERICRMGLAAAGLSLACSETPLAPTDADPEPIPVLIFTAPEPTYAVPSTGVTFTEDGVRREYAFLASFDLILRGNPENDLDVTVVSDRVVLQQLGDAPADGEGGGVEEVRFRHESRGADPIEPGGEASRAFDVWYTLPNGGRQVLIAVTLNFEDERGTAFNQIHQVTVEP